MAFDLSELFAFGLGYLTLLFAIAWIAERGWIPESLIRHPVVYTLSLGVFAGAWAMFGAVGLAHTLGYGFLAYYFGAACLFMFAPLMITPLARICRLYQLASLADLLAFRFRSRWVGMAVTICLILAMLPMLAMQIQSVSDTIRLLSHDSNALPDSYGARDTLAAIFCTTIALFTLLFGSRHISGTERHNGLVVAIAMESLFKLIALYAIAGIAIYQVFGGWNGLEQWLVAHPERIAQLRSPLHESTSRTLMLIFFASAIVMPHMFHMVFAENPTSRSLGNVAWSAPLLLLAMSLPVLPILWAGHALNSALSPEYFTLGIGLELHSPLLGMLAFIGGLSAASGAIIVITLALATMTLNHLILPFYRLRGEPDLYRRVLWTRRVLIITILAGAYVFSTAVRDNNQLSSLGMLAFIATLQFVPGVLAVLYWPRANRHGFLAGLVCGYAFWYFSLLLPFISDHAGTTLTGILQTLFSDSSQWNAVAMGSLGVNIAAFVVTSLLTPTSPEEQTAAAMCATDQLNRPARLALGLYSPQEFQRRLSRALGEKTAEREIERALKTLGFNADERRPYALRRLRDQLEANLSGLLGPATAHRLVNELLPYETSTPSGREDIQFIEQRLEHHQNDLTGLAAELDTLRRHHRQTLQELPIGLMTLGSDGEILMWNTAMEALTGIDQSSVIGSHIRTLNEPWQSLLLQFLDDSPLQSLRQECVVAGDNRCMVLHKTAGDDTHHGTRVVVVEDITETDRLTHELMHSERLASIGRLAAGVAHEIGNPVTGIACLAQNLRDETPSKEVSQATTDILTQTQRISRIVQSLVHFAHSGRSDTHTLSEAVSLHHCVHEAIELLKLNKMARPIQWRNECDTHIVLRGDAQQLQQVFINLLSNARDASPDNGVIHISAHTESTRAMIRIEDEGSGISAAIQEHVFEPFFTTKEAGKGTGLGLSLVYRIIENHHGQIRIESPCHDGRGTAFVLNLPLA
jgi:PAS domain S-box-containing protein